MQDTQARMQGESFRSAADFFRASMESVRQLMDIQARTFSALASRHTQVAGEYLKDTLDQFMDPRSITDPYGYFTRQADILMSCNRRTMDGVIEVAQEAIDLLSESRDEIDRLMSEMTQAAENGVHETQANMRGAARAGARAAEKANDRTAKADEGRKNRE